MKRKIITIAVTSAIFGSASIQAGTIEFSEVPVPTTDAQMRVVTASPSATVDGRTVDIGYNVIARSGDKIGSGVYGKLVDINGDTLFDADGEEIISNSPDFSSLLRGKHGQLFMVSHFENAPGAMYLTALQQNRRTGKLTSLRTRPLDFSEVNGGYTHCAGSVTPWGTHLGSEEYEPNAGDPNIVNNKYFAPMNAYFAGSAVANPYDYGYGIEVKVDSFDRDSVTKHYAMGRFSWELGYVMPDKKTVYASDDGTDVGLFRFVADKKTDLSSGYLYAAKWKQTSGVGAGEAVIEWINLGHASDADIKPFLDNKGTFNDIFEVDADGCTNIRTSTGNECLKVRKGMETIASRVETRRYAAIKGASTEFRKMEGITYNPDNHVLYLAISEVAKGMEDKADGGNNDIRLAKNSCGTVYQLKLDGNYAATYMQGLVAGTPVTGDPKNTCDLNGIANPDNLTFMPGYGTLIIGEDTGSGHRNDAIWAYNLGTKQLTRIETTPYGSETTSPYFYPNINGFAYVMSVVQHPYGESDQDKLINPADARAYTGYIGPFPAMRTSEDRDEDNGWRNRR